MAAPWGLTMRDADEDAEAFLRGEPRKLLEVGHRRALTNNRGETMPVKVKRIKGELKYVCECGSVLVEKDAADEILHDQYERGAFGNIDESKPLKCAFSGAKFSVPVVNLVRVPV